MEDELARTRTLLRQLQSGSRNIIANAENGEVSPKSAQGVSHDDDIQSPVQFADVSHSQPRLSSLPNENEDHRSSGALKKSSPAISLETSPAVEDFDWDERNGSALNGRFTDGMASLAEHSTRGYVGVASGAAFLRLAGEAVDESNVDVEGNDRRDAAVNTPPLLPAMFSSSQLEPFIDAYFHTYHISYPIIHEASFRAQFMEIIPRPKDRSWSVLLYIIAAIGAFAASELPPEIDQSLFQAAKARMSIDLLETGNLVLVQALTLISNYVQKTNKPNSGYNYLGLAKRMAMGIGLHKEFSEWRSNPLKLEIRRRVWWCMFVFDAGAIITFSRPLDFPKDGVEVQLPLNVSDSDITASTKVFPSNRQETCLYTHVRCQALFHLATLNIYERLLAGQLNAQEMILLDNKHLKTWLAEVPRWFEGGAVQPHSRYRFCHAKLQWRWRNLRILMYRPYLIRRLMSRDHDPVQAGMPIQSNAAEDTAIQMCLDAASDSIQLITTFWRSETKNVLTCWYSLYFLFQAIMIPMICLRNDPLAPTAVNHRDQILDALDVILDMSRVNPSAQRCHDSIMKLCGFYLTQNVAQWSSPVHESPHTQLNALQSFMWPMSDFQYSGVYDLGFQPSASLDFMASFDNSL